MDYFQQRDNIENSQSEHSESEANEPRNNRESAKSRTILANLMSQWKNQILNYVVLLKNVQNHYVSVMTVKVQSTMTLTLIPNTLR